MDIREKAILYTMGILHHASDWQEGEHALADHATFGPWLEGGDNPSGQAQDIIREAETRLGDAVPY